MDGVWLLDTLPVANPSSLFGLWNSCRCDWFMIYKFTITLLVFFVLFQLFIRVTLSCDFKCITNTVFANTFIDNRSCYQISWLRVSSMVAEFSHLQDVTHHNGRIFLEKIKKVIRLVKTIYIHLIFWRFSDVASAEKRVDRELYSVKQ